MMILPTSMRAMVVSRQLFCDWKQDENNEEKEFIIRAAAKIKKLYLSEIFVSKEEYPGAEDIRHFPKGFEFITEFLQTFLNLIVPNARFPYPLKKGEKGCIVNEWVKCLIPNEGR